MRLRILSAVMTLIFCTSQAFADWELSQSKDGFTDASMTIASTFYKDGLYTRGVVVRCNNRTLEAFVIFSNYLGNSLTPVRYRVDQGQVYSDKWLVSNDGTLVSVSEEKGFARLLANASTTLLVEATDFRGVSHRAQFDMTGAGASIRQVLTTCGTAQTDISQSWPGVRREIGLDLERWGPRMISLYKRMMAQAKIYSGDFDPTLNEEFAMAVQRYYDHFYKFCYSNKTAADSGINTECSTIRMFKADPNSTYRSSVSYVLYLNAPANLRQEAGSLKIGE